MKTMKNFLSMAALALMGAMMTGCSSDDNFDNPQQPENKSKVVTLTTTVGFDASAGTRALTADGKKTFAVDDQIAVIYTKIGGTVTKAVSEKLTSDDIASGSKSATFTVTLDNPDKTKQVTYIYPAAMAGSTDVDYTKLNSQDGTLASLQTKYDLCTNFGDWDGDNLPSLKLENKLAILAISLKNASDITGDITDMTISDGTNTYTVSRSAAAGPIYVAIRPTSSAIINVTATDGANEYGKTLSSKTYEADNGYNVTWNMSKMTTITWNSSNIDDLYVFGTYMSYPKEGITLSANNDENRAMWYNYGYESMNGIEFSTNESGGFTFTAPTGQYFTKIEMTLTGPGGWDHANLGTGWALAWDEPNPATVTWKGNAATTVGLLTDANNFNGEPVKSIVFTVY